MASSVSKAVIPVAGLGTRMLPVTAAQPKEMLPIGGKPIVQHVVEEMARSGVRDVLFVTGRGKAPIENHFDPDPALIETLRRAKRDAAMRSLDFARLGMNILYTRQPAPRGLGDAILHGEAFVGGEPFIVALGDSIIGARADSEVCRRMARALLDRGADVAVAVQQVEADRARFYGVVQPAAGGDVFPVRTIVEKPAPGSAPSRLAVAGRYVFSPSIFGAIRGMAPDAGGEVQITDAIRAVARGGGRVIGVRLQPGEERYDIGNMASYYETFLKFALADPEHGERLRSHLARHLGRRAM